jgi:hypothetical protein
MTLIQGMADAGKVAAMTDAELLAEAKRLAHNLDLTGMEYTAAVMRRLIGMVERVR